MNWNAIQAVAELAAAVAVFLSLIYVAMQLRQNTASLQAATVSRVIEAFNHTRAAVWRDPSATDVYLAAVSGKEIDNSIQAMRVRALWFSMMKDFEAVYHQYRSGHLPSDIWHSWQKEMLLYVDTPGGRDALTALGDILSPTFVTFLRSELRPAGSEAPLVVLRTKWRNAAARRRADGDEDISER
jgi:hypothetical protein